MPKRLAKTCDKMVFMNIECVSINCIFYKCRRAVVRISKLLNLCVSDMLNNYETNYDEVHVTKNCYAIHFKESYIDVRY